MALQTYQGDKTQWDNIDTTLKNAGFRPNANAVDYITNTNVQAGGPIDQEQAVLLRIDQLPARRT